MAQKQKEGGAFRRMLTGESHHVVLCATSLRPTIVLDFLKEFYAQTNLEVKANYELLLVIGSFISTRLQLFLSVYSTRGSPSHARYGESASLHFSVKRQI